MAPVKRLTAGLLAFVVDSELAVFLVHPGGPFWARRDEGAWSIPKGLCEEGEDPFAAAQREFAEEVGAPPPEGPVIDLGEIAQRGGKLIRVWAAPAPPTLSFVSSNDFEVEWPRRSGSMTRFPEVDRAEWFPLGAARQKLLEGQLDLDRLVEHLDTGAGHRLSGIEQRSNAVAEPVRSVGLERDLAARFCRGRSGDGDGRRKEGLSVVGEFGNALSDVVERAVM